MPILKRVTWMPTEAAAVSSSPIASMAARAIDRSSRHHTQSPPAQSDQRAVVEDPLVGELDGQQAARPAVLSVSPSEPPVQSRSAMMRRRITSPTASVTSPK